MALSFTVGGEKTGFGRETFLNAFTGSGIPASVAANMIDKMKSDYRALLKERISRI